MQRSSRHLADLKQIKQELYRLLGKREYSHAQLYQRLVDRVADGALLSQALEQARELDIQSDQRFALMLVKQRVRQQYGVLRIRDELSKAGVSDELVGTLTAPYTRDFWINLASSALKKKYPMPATDPREKARCHRFLAYRGFEALTINVAIRNWQQAE